MNAPSHALQVVEQQNPFGYKPRVLVIEPPPVIDTLPAATPEKRKRGKCMSRRSQVGSIETSGKWYVIRFWKDVPGQDGRIHASERICPISGPGSLTKAERKTRALAIVMSSGVNDPQKFVEATVGITFREQAKLFMEQKATSKRKPLKPATLCTWQNCLDKWLNPNLGDAPLANINNAAMKQLVAKMDAAGLSAKTIINYSGLVKLIVASAKSEEGEPLFPRKWDSEFIDLPIVRNQRQPKFTTETMSAIVQHATGQYRVLYTLLAGSGLRIGEALGLELGKHISKDCRTLYVRQSVWEGTTQKPKTASAIRDIDLCPALATILSAFIAGRTTGFLFQNDVGKPLAQSNVLRRSLHPILNALEVPKAGFHSFRRFRATHLSKSRVPESLVKFWMGHAKANQTEEYVKLFDEVIYRREVADSIGMGFDVQPEKSIVRNVRRKSGKVELGVAT
jgi:integrase